MVIFKIRQYLISYLAGNSEEVGIGWCHDAEGTRREVVKDGNKEKVSVDVDQAETICNMRRKSALEEQVFKEEFVCHRRLMRAGVITELKPYLD